MRRWTNDLWLSTLHRVIVTNSDNNNDDNNNNKIAKRRQSIAFFHNINRDAVVECLLTDNNNKAKYEPIIAGDFLMQKHLASVGIKS